MPPFNLVPTARGSLWLPSGAICETIPRHSRIDAQTPTSGALWLCSGKDFVIPAGQTVTNITFVAGGTAANGPTHWWYVLADQSLNKLGITADQTNAAFSANDPHTLALATPWTNTTEADVAVYAGFAMTVSTTMPTLAGAASTAATTAVAGLAPIISGQSSTGVTAPISGNPATIAPVNNNLYCYLS